MCVLFENELHENILWKNYMYTVVLLEKKVSETDFDEIWSFETIYYSQQAIQENR